MIVIPAQAGTQWLRFLVVAIERNREACGAGKVIGIVVQLYFNAVGQMAHASVADDVTACDKKQPRVTFEEKAAGVGEQPTPCECR